MSAPVCGADSTKGSSRLCVHTSRACCLLAPEAALCLLVKPCREFSPTSTLLWLLFLLLRPKEKF